MRNTLARNFSGDQQSARGIGKGLAVLHNTLGSRIDQPLRASLCAQEELPRMQLRVAMDAELL